MIDGQIKILSKKLDRIKVLMDASNMSIEELMATAAHKSVKWCAECPLYNECNDHYEDGCYSTWLRFLNEVEDE